jgi:putative spermidine/putrescine transport system ATP-binding protein
VEAVEAGSAAVVLPGGIRVRAVPVGTITPRARAVVAVRPEAIRVAGDEANVCRALVRSSIYLGDHQRLIAELENGAAVTVKLPAGTAVASGEAVSLAWRPADCLAFAADATSDALLNEEWNT